MIKKGRTPNLLTYLALMKMYGQVSRIDQAEAIFTKLTGQGITHPVLYFTMMDVLTKLETVERAESFLETVRKGEAGEGLPLEAMATLNLLLINMYLKLDEFEKAESFFNRYVSGFSFSLTFYKVNTGRPTTQSHDLQCHDKHV